MRNAIGFVGVGNMGSAMARRILSQGGTVVVFDLAAAACEGLAEAGARVVQSAAEVASQCEIVSVVVNYDDDVRAAMLGPQGILAGARPGSVVAVHSTIHLETLEEVAAAADPLGIGVVDATVTGGPAAAERGELAVLLGGPAEAVERVEIAIAAYASVTMRAGSLGSGMAAKLAVNLVSFVKMAAVYEGLALAKAAGVDPAELARVIAHSEEQSGLHSFFLESCGRTLRHGIDEDALKIALHESPKSQKDLHAALELASRSGIEIPVTDAAHDEMPRVWGVPDSA